MVMSFKPLEKMLIDRDMTKKELCERAGLVPSTLTRMKNGKGISTETVGKICEALGCSVSDVVEYIPGGGENE